MNSAVFNRPVSAVRDQTTEDSRLCWSAQFKVGDRVNIVVPPRPTRIASHDRTIKCPHGTHGCEVWRVRFADTDRVGEVADAFIAPITTEESTA
jgi:hypothetical protein